MSTPVQVNLIASNSSTIACVTQEVNIYAQSSAADQRYNFQPLIASYAQAFVGRSEVFVALTKFSKHDSGYFAITGESGLGKTALAAEIARRFDATAFFVNAQENRTSAARCLNHLSADLITRFDLPYTHLPARNEADASFLIELLEKVAEIARPLWLVVDALDEADFHPGRNPMLLPLRLPRGVYIAITYRPESVIFSTAPGTPLQIYKLERDSESQFRDLRSFLEGKLHSGVIFDRLALTLHDHALIVDRLLDASEGNFLYLDFLLSDLDQEILNPQTLLTTPLPHGLHAYYEQGWQIAASSGTEILALILAAFEPVSTAWVSEVSGSSRLEIEHALKPWNRFVTQNAAGLWRAVHKSFVEFASNRSDLGAAHKRIAGFFIPPARWKTTYASQHLSAHLQHDPTALFRLIRDPRWQASQDAGDVSGAAYMSDLRRAWRVAEKLNEEAVSAERETPYLAEEAWCAVRFREISRVVPQFIFSNLSAFLQSELVPISTALSLLDKVPGDLSGSLEAVWRMVKVEGTSPAVFNQLFEFVKGLKSENVRWHGLRDLISHAPAARVADFFAASFNMSDRRSELELLTALLVQSVKPWPMQAQSIVLRRIQALDCSHCRAWLTSVAAPHLASELRAPALATALEEARSLPGTLYAPWTIGQVAAAHQGTQRRELFREAFFLAEKIENPDLQLNSLLENLRALGQAGPLQGEDLNLVLALAEEEIKCLHCRAVYLAAASQYVPGANGNQIFRQAEALIPYIIHEGDRAGAATRLAGYCKQSVPATQIVPPFHFEPTSELVELAEQAVRDAASAEVRARALVGLASYLDEPRKSETLRLAIESAVEAARVEKIENKRIPPYPRMRGRTRPLVGEPKLQLQVSYVSIPAKKAANKLKCLRAFLRTPYPLPAGLRELDLGSHGTVPWQVTWYSPTIKGPVFVDFDRLSWAKELTELQRGKSEGERREMMELAQALTASIIERDTSILANAFLTVARGLRSELHATLEAVRTIRFEPYRAEGLILLYPTVESAERKQILSEALSTALRTRGEMRSRYLRHLSPAGARLSRPALYALFRDMVSSFNGDWDDRWPTFAESLEEIFPMVTALAGMHGADKTIVEAVNAAS